VSPECPLDRKARTTILRALRELERGEGIPLEKWWAVHRHFRKAEYRIAYRIQEEKRQVEAVLVKNRERFCEVLAQSLR
jgi:mRNA-degrading endonuclease RelE of RelBE toxin-antitoxin system